MEVYKLKYPKYLCQPAQGELQDNRQKECSKIVKFPPQNCCTNSLTADKGISSIIIKKKLGVSEWHLVTPTDKSWAC